jgi:hypothetical protein
MVFERPGKAFNLEERTRASTSSVMRLKLEMEYLLVRRAGG